LEFAAPTLAFRLRFAVTPLGTSFSALQLLALLFLFLFLLFVLTLLALEHAVGSRGTIFSGRLVAGQLDVVGVKALGLLLLDAEPLRACSDLAVRAPAGVASIIPARAVGGASGGAFLVVLVQAHGLLLLRAELPRAHAFSFFRALASIASIKPVFTAFGAHFVSAIAAATFFLTLGHGVEVVRIALAAAVDKLLARFAVEVEAGEGPFAHADRLRQLARVVSVVLAVLQALGPLLLLAEHLGARSDLAVHALAGVASIKPAHAAL